MSERKKHGLPKIRDSGQFVLHENSEPLYRRAPTLDENGKPYVDFMLLIPGLNKVSTPELKEKMASLQSVLVNYPEVVFADLNLRLNLLWVSLKPKAGLIQLISVDIQNRVPEAKLISGDFRK
jgi:hypothetical protein